VGRATVTRELRADAAESIPSVWLLLTGSAAKLGVMDGGDAGVVAMVEPNSWRLGSWNSGSSESDPACSSDSSSSAVGIIPGAASMAAVVFGTTRACWRGTAATAAA